MIIASKHVIKLGFWSSNNRINHSNVINTAKFQRIFSRDEFFFSYLIGTHSLHASPAYETRRWNGQVPVLNSGLSTGIRRHLLYFLLSTSGGLMVSKLD